MGDILKMLANQLCLPKPSCVTHLLLLLPHRWRFRGIVRGRLEVVNDLLSEYVGLGEIVGFLEAFVSDPEDVGLFSSR
jgi:hypothetical protein